MGKEEMSNKIFQRDIGQKATVQREEVSGESAARPNRLLVDLGIETQKVDPRIASFDYRGSAAIHIYTHEQLNMIQFISQADPLLLYRCPEELAARGFDDLLRAMKKIYGKGHGSLRSGF